MQELAVIEQRELLGKDFKIYGNFENPLFLAKDVAEWIEHSNPSKMIADADLTDNEIAKITISYNGDGCKITPPITQLFLTEDGLYEVLMQSRKPIAKAFKKEVKEILKTIRKTGGHVTIGREEDFIQNYFPLLDESTKQTLVLDLNKKLQEQAEARRLAEQKAEALLEDNKVKQNTISALTGQLIKIMDRTLFNQMIRHIGQQTAMYQETYNKVYDLLYTRCSIDVRRRAKYRGCSKIDTIAESEWSKIIPVVVAWYLKNGGSEEYLKTLVEAC